MSLIYTKMGQEDNYIIILEDTDKASYTRLKKIEEVFAEKMEDIISQEIFSVIDYETENNTLKINISGDNDDKKNVLQFLYEDKFINEKEYNLCLKSINNRSSDLFKKFYSEEKKHSMEKPLNDELKNLAKKVKNFI